MKINRHPSMPRGLRRVVKSLSEIADRRDHALDLTQARGELRRLVDAMAPEHVDEEIYTAIDRYVDSYVSDFLRDMHERHSVQLNELDRLEIRVRPYLERADALNHDEHSRLTHLDAAVMQALALLGDPDTPLHDSIPHQPRRERRP